MATLAQERARASAATAIARASAATAIARAQAHIKAKPPEPESNAADVPITPDVARAMRLKIEENRHHA